MGTLAYKSMLASSLEYKMSNEEQDYNRFDIILKTLQFVYNFKLTSYKNDYLQRGRVAN